MTTQDTAPVTFLYTDLVNSTKLLSRLGDERAQRVFQAHHKLLREATEANGGREVKWQGDGVMVAFTSTAAAVRCAISMQQLARRPVGQELLEIRVGLNVGEALGWEETDYFGTPVVVAARLCNEASAGQILCSALVAGLLSGRKAFSFKNYRALELKGIAEPVATCDVLYEDEQDASYIRHAPFVGRAKELATLHGMLERARAGRGGIVTLSGEPGIGKTKTAAEFVAEARNHGVITFWGRCSEGEWAPPYEPFMEAIREYCRTGETEALVSDLATGSGAIARLIPELRGRLPDVAEPPPLPPDEERLRLFDAVSQFLIAVSKRAPVVLVLDDLHWIDKGTLGMLRHVARFAPQHAMLLVGTYRDTELNRQHPLADALESFRRDGTAERIVLKGLDAGEVGELMVAWAGQRVPDVLVQAISTETDGNPLFVDEVITHLSEKRAIYERDGRWVSDASSIKELGIPEGVRQAIGRRVARLSDDSQSLVAVASAFGGSFRFNIAAEVAELDEAAALDALDEALQAQLLRPCPEPDSLDFRHALIRHTLYTELSPPRQVRLHRKVAEAMEQHFGDRTGEHAAELAYQYHRSSTLPGAERGVEYALAAADQAEAAYAREEMATFLRIALELLPEADQRRPHLLGRLGLALAWSLEFDEALEAATKAGDLIAAAEGEDAGADYLAEATRTMSGAGFMQGAWALAQQGLPYVGARRDATWAWLMARDILRREAEDPDNPGIPLDTPELREVARLIENLPAGQRPLQNLYLSSREDVLGRRGEEPVSLVFWAGEYRRGLALLQEQAAKNEQQGQIAGAVLSWALVATCEIALGDFAAARVAYGRAVALSARLAGPSVEVLNLAAARMWMNLALHENWEELLAEMEPLLQEPAAEHHYALAPIQAAAAAVYARLGRTEEALRWLRTLLPPLERAPAWANSYPALACLAAWALWELQRTDHAEVIERNLREKVVMPDFRYPMMDGRLALARLCALQNRYDEARDWFAKARTVLDEQGARPLRAIVDHDEALMYHRRGEPGDKELAAPLLDAALTQFRELGMTGWITRAEQLGQG